MSIRPRIYRYLMSRRGVSTQLRKAHYARQTAMRTALNERRAAHARTLANWKRDPTKFEEKWTPYYILAKELIDARKWNDATTVIKEVMNISHGVSWHIPAAQKLLKQMRNEP